MLDFLSQEKIFLDRLKEQFDGLDDAKMVDSFLHSKFIDSEEVTPSLFIEHEKLNNGPFFNTIAKSVFNRFKKEFFLYVNQVFFDIIGKSYSLEELVNTKTLERLSEDFKEAVETESLFDFFFNDLVPEFVYCDEHLKIDTPLELAQFVRQCDYFDSCLKDREGQELETRIEWIYEGSSLYFEKIRELGFIVEYSSLQFTVDEVAAHLIKEKRTLTIPTIEVSDLTISGVFSPMCFSELIEGITQVSSGLVTGAFSTESASEYHKKRRTQDD